MTLLEQLRKLFQRPRRSATGFAVVAFALSVLLATHGFLVSLQRADLAQKVEQRTRALAHLEELHDHGVRERLSTIFDVAVVPTQPARTATGCIPERGPTTAPEPVAPEPVALEPLALEPLALKPVAAPAEPTYFEVRLASPPTPTAHGALRGPTGNRVLLGYQDDRRWFAEGATHKGWQVVHIGRSAVILEQSARGARPPRVVREIYSDE